MEVKYQKIKEFGEKSKIRTIIREKAVKLEQYLREDKEREDFFSNPILDISS